MQKFMFDSNAFSNLLKSDVDWETFFTEHKEKFEFIVTAMQVEELAIIPDKDKENRVRHILCLFRMNVKLAPTNAVVGNSRTGLCKIGNEQEQDTYNRLLNSSGRNIHDAMIGEAAVREGCTLITDDNDHIKKLYTAEFPYMTFEKFCETIGLEAKG